MTARVRLRPTMQSDLTYVLSLEQDEENLPFITPWDRTQHEAAIRFPDFRHFIIEGGEGLDAVGFLILIGCRSQH
ncbi:MAG: N-acetyltransferase, partial [Burkholderiaceae bacterium]